jgi:hypothetical protein
MAPLYRAQRHDLSLVTITFSTYCNRACNGVLVSGERESPAFFYRRPTRKTESEVFCFSFRQARASQWPNVSEGVMGDLDQTIPDSPRKRSRSTVDRYVGNEDPCLFSRSAVLLVWFINIFTAHGPALCITSNTH